MTITDQLAACEKLFGFLPKGWAVMTSLDFGDSDMVLVQSDLGKFRATVKRIVSKHFRGKENPGTAKIATPDGVINFVMGDGTSVVLLMKEGEGGKIAFRMKRARMESADGLDMLIQVRDAIFKYHG